MKVLDFSTTDDSLISVSQLSAFGFGLPSLVAPSQAKSIAWEESVTADDTVCRFMGHGITVAGLCQSAMHALSDADKKDAVKGLAVLHTTVAAMIGHATHKKELKQTVGVANVVLHSALAVACAARGFSKEKDDEA